MIESSKSRVASGNFNSPGHTVKLSSIPGANFGLDYMRLIAICNADPGFRPVPPNAQPDTIEAHSGSTPRRPTGDPGPLSPNGGSQAMAMWAVAIGVIEMISVIAVVALVLHGLGG
jgi:hypothetical protein